MRPPFGLFRLGVISVALLASASPLPVHAQAQSSLLAPPAERFAISPGGVDMRSGRFVYSQTDLGIGPQEDGLAFTRTLVQPVAGHTSPFANFSHNWEILLSEKRVNIQQGDFRNQTGTDYQMEVSIGGLQDTFRSTTSAAGYDHTSRSGYATLTFTGTKSSGAVYTYRRGDGVEAVFRQIGSNDCSSTMRCAYVSELTEADGTRYSFHYDDAGGSATKLLSVTSNRGFALILEYSGGFISKACLINLAVTTLPPGPTCPTSGVPTATYSYASVGGASRLASATDAGGGVWGFAYSGANMGFVRPGQTSAWLTNTIQTRTNDDGLTEEIVTHQSFADGSSYSYSFNESPFVENHISQIAGGSYADALDATTTLTYEFPIAPGSPRLSCNHEGCPFYYVEDTPQYTNSYQITPGPTQVIDPLNRTTTSNYCDANAAANLPSNETNRCVVTPRAISTTDPEGIVTNMSWDFVTGNLLATEQVPKVGSSLAHIQRSAAYNCTASTFRYCNKPTSVTDARGNTTNFSYSADHGGLLRETGPPPSSGAASPETRHSYAQRYARISNGSGGYLQAATPLWVRTATSTCRTSAASATGPYAPCSAANDEVLVQYDYGPDSGPNNLLLRGMTVTSTDLVAGSPATTTLRTCYGYDALGRRISQTQPNANLTSCP